MQTGLPTLFAKNAAVEITRKRTSIFPVAMGPLKAHHSLGRMARRNSTVTLLLATLTGTGLPTIFVKKRAYGMTTTKPQLLFFYR